VFVGFLSPEGIAPRANAIRIESRMACETLMSEEDIAEFAAVWASVIAGIVKQMERYFGKSDCVSLNHEKLNVHGTVLDDRIIVVTARKDLPLDIVLGLGALCSAPHLKEDRSEEPGIPKVQGTA